MSRLAIKRCLLAMALLTGFTLCGATINRSTKPNGTTSWVDGDTLTASGLNGDADNVVNEINGSLDDDNITAAADIAVTKIGDDSADDATQATTSDPATSEANTLATTLQTEIRQLRHKLEQLTVGTGCDGVASSGGTSTNCSWIDGPYRPGNLLYNGGFDVWTSAANAAGDGWALVLTPDTAATSLTEAEGQGDGQGMLITGNGAALEGISQTLDGLKASTRYHVRVSVRDDTGTCRLGTSGADTNEFSTDSDDSGDWQVLEGNFETDSTPTDVDIQLLAVADGDVCLFDHAAVWEINTDPVPAGQVIGATDNENTTANQDISDSFATLTGVDTITVTPPSSNYVVLVIAQACVDWDVTNNSFANVRIQETVANVTVAESKIFFDAGDANESSCTTLHHANLTPTPGTVLTYALQAECTGGATHCDMEVGNAESKLTVLLLRSG